jgi:outer membrane receptor protein involved in Fe transport
VQLASGAAALVLSLVAASAVSAQTAPATPATSEETIQLSPFTVSTDKDVGYTAANSLSGTRTNTPIRDIPLNITVFTKDLADDFLVKSQLDFEAYNAALVYGGNDTFSDNPIQQPYQELLVRGFRQNWGLRDGVREYDPVDIQNIARVEFVKGPAAPLYGLAYPGGVMNNITKSVDFSHNFAQLRATVGNFSDWRAQIDANATASAGNGGKFGIRFNAASERAQDERDHSKGRNELAAVEAEWRPTRDTQLEFMMERGYREKPNGLQYFSYGSDVAGNGSDVPLQIKHPEISWDWNWSNGKDFRSIEEKLYRGKITQQVGDSLGLQAYVQYTSRLNIDGNGWDANGSGGADSWESSGSGLDTTKNTITETYHYRDWGNEMHAYGATGTYKLDIAGTKNTFSFGANVWGEKELSRASRPLNPLASAIVLPIQQGIQITVPNFPPADLTPESDGGPNGNGYHHENNSNDYYFLNWMFSAMDNRLKLQAGANQTHMKLLTWNNGASQNLDNAYSASKLSPMFGGMFDITKEVSVFLNHSTSLFPDSTKDSFGNQFGPQVGDSWEGGIKLNDLADGKLSGTISYFQIEQTGGTQSSPNHENSNTARWDRLTPEQRAIEFPGKTRADLFAAGDIISGGKQQSKGFDIDLVYSPIKELQMVFSYEHVNHEFVTSADPSTIGQTYPDAVKNRASLLTKYSFRQGGLKGLSAGVGISYFDKQLVDYFVAGGRYTPARYFGDAFAQYRVKIAGYDTIWQLNIRNLLQTPVYVGWKATGSSTVIATERYKVPTKMGIRLTAGIDF